MIGKVFRRALIACLAVDLRASRRWRRRVGCWLAGLLVTKRFMLLYAFGWLLGTTCSHASI